MLEIQINDQEDSSLEGIKVLNFSDEKWNRN